MKQEIGVELRDRVGSGEEKVQVSEGSEGGGQRSISTIVWGNYPKPG